MQNGDERFVYIGNLDFFKPVVEVKEALSELLRGGQVAARLVGGSLRSSTRPTSCSDEPSPHVK